MKLIFGYYYNTHTNLIFAITILYNLICVYQLKKFIHDKEQKDLNKKLNDNKKSFEIRINLIKKDEKKINKFYNKIDIKYCKTINKIDNLAIYKHLYLVKV